MILLNDSIIVDEYSHTYLFPGQSTAVVQLCTTRTSGTQKVALAVSFSGGTSGRQYLSLG